MGPAATVWLRLVRRFAPLVIFAIGFAILLLVILHFYMAPAMRAAEHASPRERRLLAVQSRLLLVVVLFVLFALLALTFRIGRGMNRSARSRKPTAYPDAWAEAARRVKPAPDDPTE